MKSGFVGYAQERKAYKCYVPSSHETLISRDVVFDELASWYGNPVAVPTDGSPSMSHAETTPVESTSMSGQTGDVSSTVSPWTGRLRHGYASEGENR